MRRSALLGVAACALSIPAGPRRHEGPSAADPPTIARATARRASALSFEENLGQSDADARFLCRAPQGTLLLADDGFRVGHGAGTAMAQFVGANPTAAPRGDGPLPGAVNSFRGRDPARWVRGARTFERVLYAGLWPGIDLVFRSSAEGLEYDFRVAPGADPTAIRLAVDGARIAPCGDLEAADGAVRHRKPRVFEETTDGPRELPARFEATADGAFTVAYASATPGAAILVDPVLEFSSLFGGSSFEDNVHVATAPDGGPVLFGRVGPKRRAEGFPATFPAPSAFGPASAVLDIGDVFVSKLSPDGAQVLFTTFLGSSKTDDVGDVAVAADGTIWVCGSSGAADFPTTANALRQTEGGNRDGFLTRLSADGSQLLYSSFVGGGGTDFAFDVDLDSAGRVLVAGQTFSKATFIPAPTLPASADAFLDGFVVQIDPTRPAASQLRWGAFLGGNGGESEAVSVAVGPGDSVFVLGTTESQSFPATPGAFQTTPGAQNPDVTGARDAFVARFDAAGARQWTTLLGGSGTEARPGFGRSASLDVDALGHAVVAMLTESNDFPTTAGAFQRAAIDAGEFGNDAVVLRLAADGSSLDWSTFIGGRGQETATAVRVAADGDVLVAGRVADSRTFPTAGSVIKSPKPSKSLDGFAARLAQDGATLRWSALFGARRSLDTATGIAEDAQGGVWVSGNVLGVSRGFPLVHAVDVRQVDVDAFLARLAPDAAVVAGGKLSAPAQAAFRGRVPVGRQTLATVVVRNSSRTEPLGFTAAATGTFTARSAATQTVIPPKGSARVLVEVVPPAAGVQTGTLVLTTTDPQRPQVTVKLRAVAR